MQEDSSPPRETFLDLFIAEALSKPVLSQGVSEFNILDHIGTTVKEEQEGFQPLQV